MLTVQHEKHGKKKERERERKRSGGTGNERRWQQNDTEYATVRLRVEEKLELNADINLHLCLEYPVFAMSSKTGSSAVRVSIPFRSDRSSLCFAFAPTFVSSQLKALSTLYMFILKTYFKYRKIKNL